MQNILLFLNIFRSVPVFIIFYTLDEKQHILEDMIRCGGTGTLWNLHKLLVNSKNFRRVFLTRVSFDSKIKQKILRLFYKPTESFAIDVVSKKMGGGIQVFHGNSTIVYAQKIGKNFSVYQNVTIGRGKSRDGIDIPVIGDDVVVYTGAIIIGGVFIGNNVKVGAGALVNKDVPDNCTVVGNPMKVIYKGRTDESIN